MQRLRHVQMRGLEDTLRDPKRDPVHEQALPELERRRRCLLQARKVGQVAAEGVPALGLLLARPRTAAPHADPRRGPDEDGRVRECATAERGEHDVAPARRRRAPAGDRDRQEDDPDDDEDGDPEHDDPDAGVHVPPVPLDRRPDVRLEALEALAVGGAVGGDPLAEARERLRSLREDVVDDLGDGVLERGQLRPVTARELEVGDLLVTEPAPDALLGRDGLRGVAAAPDQVEERRGELERAGLGLLAEERRHERRLGVGRRLLLVLAVVAAPALAPVDRPDDRHEDERRANSEQEQVEERAADVSLRVVDLRLVARVRRDVRGLLLFDLGESTPVRGGEKRARKDDAELDELVRRHAGRAEVRDRRRPVDDPVHPLWVPVDAVALVERGRLRQPHLGAQPREPNLPFAAPHLQVDVDDVPVGDGEPAEPVRDRERPRVGLRLVVPDDADALRARLDAVLVRAVDAAELRVPARAVRPAVLADEDVVDRLAVAKGDVAIGAAERAEEVEGDVLADEQGAVRRDRDVDVGRGERVVLRLSRAGERECRDNGDDED